MSYTPLHISYSQFGRMRRVVRHWDVEQSVGATDFPVPLCCDIYLPRLCRVAACVVCRLRVGKIGNILH